MTLPRVRQCTLSTLLVEDCGRFVACEYRFLMTGCFDSLRGSANSSQVLSQTYLHPYVITSTLKMPSEYENRVSLCLLCHSPYCPLILNPQAELPCDSTKYINTKAGNNCSQDYKQFFRLLLLPRFSRS